MGRQIDHSKPLSDDDREWLNSRSRSWEVDENDRTFADDPSKGGEKPEEDWVPTNTIAADPFGGEAENTRKVPYPVGVEEPAVDQDANSAVVDIDELTVEELKGELQELGQPTSGNKAELQERLKKALK